MLNGCKQYCKQYLQNRLIAFNAVMHITITTNLNGDMQSCWVSRAIG